ncbi:hypothetical protein EVAR_18915_1 [Eumeta japonica]|uniref:Uncharacterized protein n=1 Tax=Eumeta variegata TaxID=151549 RepID=A0A4C1V3D7_EUMVA|nr:hypothetical protein EVAR_18915_1 [Eumeta japonica]
MLFERGENMTECDVLIEGEEVDQVKEFVYLGSLLTNDAFAAAVRDDTINKSTAETAPNRTINEMMRHHPGENSHRLDSGRVYASVIREPVLINDRAVLEMHDPLRTLHTARGVHRRACRGLESRQFPIATVVGRPRSYGLTH